MRQQLGLDRPVFGHVWESERWPSGAKLDPRRFDHLGIEGEFAIRLSDDVPSIDYLMKHPEVVSAAFVVIELHHYVFRGALSVRAAELVANNAIHAGVVLPIDETPFSDVDDLHQAKLRVNVNERELGVAAGADLEGGPLAGLPALVEHLDRHGQRLRKGQIVLTGSPLPLWHVAPGDRIDVKCEAFGKNAFARVVG
jgi:2-keto-4-pentenoate hydratase